LKGFGKAIQKYQSDKWDMNRRVSFEICYKKAGKKQIVANSIKPVKPEIKNPDTLKTKIEQFVEKAEVGDKIALKNIIFYGGTPDPMPESTKTLKDLLKTLKNNPTIEICIEGHICCHSTDNDDLSGRRALAVYDYLVENGIDKNRLSYKGFGRTQPLTQERTSAEQQMNRRVEIRITKK
jgi:outer membrane protein OmpA-like peptidoglycan-associated protein